MSGFVLVFNGKILPESFRFTKEACKGITANWFDDDGKCHAFGWWRARGYKLKPAWLELRN